MHIHRMPTFDLAPDESRPPVTAPGDEAAPGAEGTGQNVCPRCGGSGRTGRDEACPVCDGTGTITEGIGGG